MLILYLAKLLINIVLDMQLRCLPYIGIRELKKCNKMFEIRNILWVVFAEIGKGVRMMDNRRHLKISIS